MWTLRAKPVSVLSSLVCEWKIITFTNFGSQDLRFLIRIQKRRIRIWGRTGNEKCLGLEPLFLSALISSLPTWKTGGIGSSAILLSANPVPDAVPPPPGPAMRPSP